MRFIHAAVNFLIVSQSSVLCNGLNHLVLQLYFLQFLLCRSISKCARDCVSRLLQVDGCGEGVGARVSLSVSRSCTTHCPSGLELSAAGLGPCC